MPIAAILMRGLHRLFLAYLVGRFSACGINLLVVVCFLLFDGFNYSNAVFSSAPSSFFLPHQCRWYMD